ncbi:MlaA family lipoprotein [Solimicrobium silvestre]|uniref:Surface lipoprotein n=1 Tax=Solimicrobium silvestre TaxID=2099400 RepID=A0A2S9H200_9BURK|nr:VacJ family lipoprotein [Solimicrobium silvestre]PRC94015.1 Surface lipoprotein [Solimicrobium silvestre]
MKLKALVLAVSLFALSGCATVPNEDGTQSSRVDPFESMNRSTSAFNDKFDQNLFQPVARAYVNVVPGFVQTGIGNFFGNINDVWTAANSFLQGNVEDGFSDIMRFSLNSTFGFLGILDIASEARIPKHRKDFGQTLGVWGVPNGPYLVIPFLGPSVMRDAAALPADYYADLWTYTRPVYIRNIGSGVRLVDKRAGYLDASSLLEDAALDKYIFIRDAYLQRIASQIESRKDAKQNREDNAEMQRQSDDDVMKEPAMSGTPSAVKPLPTP